MSPKVLTFDIDGHRVPVQWSEPRDPTADELEAIEREVRETVPKAPKSRGPKPRALKPAATLDQLRTRKGELEATVRQMEVAGRTAKFQRVELANVYGQMREMQPPRPKPATATSPTYNGRLHRAFTVRPGANVNRLTDEAKSVLYDVGEYVHKLGGRAIITSGKRSGSIPSHHNDGNAVDLVLHGLDMQGIADRLRAMGYRAEFERKGQVNPNGSVSTGDHIHISLHRPSGRKRGDGSMLRPPADMRHAKPRVRNVKYDPDPLALLRELDTPESRAKGQAWADELSKTLGFGKKPDAKRPVAKEPLKNLTGAKSPGLLAIEAYFRGQPKSPAPDGPAPLHPYYRMREAAKRDAGEKREAALEAVRTMKGHPAYVGSDAEALDMATAYGSVKAPNTRKTSFESGVNRALRGGEKVFGGIATSAFPGGITRNLTPDQRERLAMQTGAGLGILPLGGISDAMPFIQAIRTDDETPILDAIRETKDSLNLGDPKKTPYEKFVSAVSLGMLSLGLAHGARTALRLGKRIKVEPGKGLVDLEGYLEDTKVRAALQDAGVSPDEVSAAIRGGYGANGTQVPGSRRAAFESALVRKATEAGIPKAQAVAVTKAWRRVAQTWAANTGNSIDDAYARVARITLDEDAPKGALFQIMTARESDMVSPEAIEQWLSKAGKKSGETIKVGVAPYDRTGVGTYENARTGATAPMQGGAGFGKQTHEGAALAFTTQDKTSGAKKVVEDHGTDGYTLIIGQGRSSVLTNTQASRNVVEEMKRASDGVAALEQGYLDRYNSAFDPRHISPDILEEHAIKNPLKPPSGPELQKLAKGWTRDVATVRKYEKRETRPGKFESVLKEEREVVYLRPPIARSWDDVLRDARDLTYPVRGVLHDKLLPKAKREQLGKSPAHYDEVYDNMVEPIFDIGETGDIMGLVRQDGRYGNDGLALGVADGNHQSYPWMATGEHHGMIASKPGEGINLYDIVVPSQRKEVYDAAVKNAGGKVPTRKQIGGQVLRVLGRSGWAELPVDAIERIGYYLEDAKSRRGSIGDGQGVAGQELGRYSPTDPRLDRGLARVRDEERGGVDGPQPAPDGAGSTTLHQRADGVVKAAVTLDEAERAVLHLFTGKTDVSSLLHESFHVWRRMLPEADLAILEKHFGDVRSVKAEEAFSRAGERYLRDGRAPDPELQRLFDQFSGWLRGVYAKLKGSPLEAEVHPDVRGVFDRMFGGEDAPAKAKGQRPAKSVGPGEGGGALSLALPTGHVDPRTGRALDDLVPDGAEPPPPGGAPDPTVGAQAKDLGSSILEPDPLPEAAPGRGGGNRVFTQESYLAAKERIRRRRGRAAAGVDPEELRDWAIVAGHHVESGLREFGAWSRAMVDELGERVRPHLDSLWKRVSETLDDHRRMAEEDAELARARGAGGSGPVRAVPDEEGFMPFREFDDIPKDELWPHAQRAAERPITVRLDHFPEEVGYEAYKAAQKDAEKYFKAHLDKEWVRVPGFGRVHFSSATWEKLARGNFTTFNLIPEIPRLLRAAQYMWKERAKRPEGGYWIGAHRLVVRVKTPKGDFNVWIVVREPSDGRFYYTHFYTDADARWFGNLGDMPEGHPSRSSTGTNDSTRSEDAAGLTDEAGRQRGPDDGPEGPGTGGGASSIAQKAEADGVKGAERALSALEDLFRSDGNGPRIVKEGGSEYEGREGSYRRREGTNPEQERIARGELLALLHRRASVLARAIARRAVGEGGDALLHQRVESPEDVATLAQIVRNAQWEVFRYLFVKDGKVVHESAVSARLPGATQVFVKDDLRELAQWVRGLVEKTGADTIWALHNHPSGRANPSPQDIDVTRKITALIPEIKGHVIIDSNEYAVIQRDGTSEVIAKDFHHGGPDPLHTPAVPHVALGRQMRSVADVAETAALFKHPEGTSLLIGLDAGSLVRSVTTVPSRFLEGDTERLPAFLRRFGRQTGSVAIFISAEPALFDKIGTDPALADRLAKAIRTRLVMDVIAPDGRRALDNMGGRPVDREPGVYLGTRIDGATRWVRDSGGDDGTYSKAKPHLDAALKAFVDSGKSAEDFARFARENLGPAASRHLDRFLRDTPRSGSSTGTKNATTKSERVERGLPEPPRTSPRSGRDGASALEVPTHESAASPSPTARTRATVAGEIEYLRRRRTGRASGTGSRRRGSGDVDPEDLRVAKDLAVRYVEYGHRSFAEFSREMLTEFGTPIRPHLRRLYGDGHTGAGDPVSRLIRLVDGARTARGEAGAPAGVLGRPGGRDGSPRSTGATKGQLPSVRSTPPERGLTAEERDDLFVMAMKTDGLQPSQKLNAQRALATLLGGELPTAGQQALLQRVYGPDLVQAILRKRTMG
jgi:DNA repair protein RadC